MNADPQKIHGTKVTAEARQYLKAVKHVRSCAKNYGPTSEKRVLNAGYGMALQLP